MLPTDRNSADGSVVDPGPHDPAEPPPPSQATIDLTGPDPHQPGGETGGDSVVIEIDTSASAAADPPAEGEEPAPPPIDGRHARSERSRQAMVEALLELLREGTLRPSSAQIAERAGVTQRTLFNQFGDMDSLVAAVAASQVRRVLSMLPEAGTGSLEERAAAYSAGLALLLEETMHVRWAVLAHASEAETGVRAVQTAREFMRSHMEQAFAPELGTLDDETKQQVLDALEPLSDPAAWRLRRVQQGLSTEQARDAVRRTLQAVVRDALGPGAG